MSSICGTAWELALRRNKRGSERQREKPGVHGKALGLRVELSVSSAAVHELPNLYLFLWFNLKE